MMDSLNEYALHPILRSALVHGRCPVVPISMFLGLAVLRKPLLSPQCTCKIPSQKCFGATGLALLLDVPREKNLTGGVVFVGMVNAARAGGNDPGLISVSPNMNKPWYHPATSVGSKQKEMCVQDYMYSQETREISGESVVPVRIKASDGTDGFFKGMRFFDGAGHRH